MMCDGVCRIVQNKPQNVSQLWCSTLKARLCGCRLFLRFWPFFNGKIWIPCLILINKLTFLSRERFEYMKYKIQKSKMILPANSSVASPIWGKLKEPSRFLLFFPIFSLFFLIFSLFFPIFGNFFAVKRDTLPPTPEWLRQCLQIPPFYVLHHNFLKCILWVDVGKEWLLGNRHYFVCV